MQGRLKGTLSRFARARLIAPLVLLPLPALAASFGGLAPREAISLKDHAHSVVADDVNGDGKVDLVVSTAAANSVAILLGEGPGKFAAPVYYGVGTTPKFTVTGDFNGDGHRDLVVADQDSNEISVLIGKGDGTFGAATNYPACKGAHEVAVADFNHDQHEDAVVACHGQPYAASLFLGKGDGTFADAVSLAAGDEPTAVAIADFNGDGHPDLAFADRAANAVGLLLGKGDGTFADLVSIPTGESPHGIRAASLTKSGTIDLVTVNDHGNSVSVLAGKGDGTFAPHADLPARALPKSVGLGDLNGDGLADIVITNTSYPECCTVGGTKVSVFLNEGDYKFSARTDYPAGGNPFSLLIRDLDGDGKVDVATANFVDYTPARQAFLRVSETLGVDGKMARRAITVIVIGLFALIGLLAGRRSRVKGLAVGVAVGLVLGAGLYVTTRPRIDGPSHLSILRGQ